MTAPILLWLRQDLRLADNPALAAALASSRPIIPVFVHAPEEEGDWRPGGASLWWLNRSLHTLSADLERRGSRLILRASIRSSIHTLRTLLAETGATSVHWNRRYEPAAIQRDKAIKQALRDDGLEVHSFNAALLSEPWEIRNRAGAPFQVFTPYWRHVLSSLDPPAPTPIPKRLPAVASTVLSEPIDVVLPLPRIAWYTQIAASWQPGEAGAARKLADFFDRAIGGYARQRDIPGVRGTSMLSPHLHFGEISPRQIWHAVAAHAPHGGLAPTEWRASKFLAEIGWREFAHHLLYHFPYTPLEPLRREYQGFPWAADNAAQLGAWQRGHTGIPMVDAGMRELWATGWMHNRVRMVVASFLVKNLRLPWQHGARWFWDTLVDADLANNTQGWQWSAGCGADAAPYFRVFNPVSQGRKFDPQGEYVRRWVPEIARLPDDLLHAPWEASTEQLHQAGIEIGQTYPAPIVDLKGSREAALAAFTQLRSSLA